MASPPTDMTKTRRLWPIFGVALIAALTIASGAIQGRISNRWGTPPDLLAAGKLLQEVPAQFGNWQLDSSDELSKNAAAMLECAGYIVRQYRNEQSGQTIDVAVLVGPSGPISVHTPEVCFPSRDSQPQGERRRVAIPTAEGRTDEFWALTFKAADLAATRRRVYYGWSTGSQWTAAEDPRFGFADRPYLYKIQLSGSLLPGMDEPVDEASDPCREFLKEFVPVVSRYLIEPQPRTES